MKKRILLVLSISIMLLMSACGKQTVSSDEQTIDSTIVVETETTDNAAESESESEVSESETIETEYVEPIENTESTEMTDDTTTEPLFIRMENPSWEYYTAESVVSGTKPFGIKLFEESANEIIDTDAWFEKNELQLTGNSNEEEYGCYIDYDGVIVCITKGGEVIAELEFTEFMYAPDLVEEDRDFVDEKVRDAKIRNGVLYVSISHLTYAESAPSNAYIMALSLEDYSIIWKSEPLVCNSYNFEIVDDIIFTGYGFTAEPDYLFQIDRLTGTVLEQYKINSRADYIICKDDKLYVRTYDTDYVFEVSR